VDISEAALERLREGIRQDWPELLDRVEVSTDAAAAVRQADIVCTATTSRKPVFADSDLKPGTHVSGVGAYTPQMQEVPAETVVRATVVVDAVDAALEEGGDLIIPLNQGLVTRDHFSRELGMLVNGEATGRTSRDEITFFKSVGNAVQDVVVAKRAVARAREDGVGIEIDLAQ
jgi:ornithine cyclodeaminase